MLLNNVRNNETCRAASVIESTFVFPSLNATSLWYEVLCWSPLFWTRLAGWQVCALSSGTRNCQFLGGGEREGATRLAFTCWVGPSAGWISTNCANPLHTLPILARPLSRGAQKCVFIIHWWGGGHQFLVYVLVPATEHGYFVASWWRTPLRHPLKVTKFYFQQASGIHAPVGKIKGCSLSDRSPALIADNFHVATMARKQSVLNLWEINRRPRTLLLLPC
jgi:hypothetical protein